MTIAAYIGRKTDVLAYQGAVAGGERQLDQQLVSATSGGQITTGVQKLAQRFLLVLLTPRGSKVHFPDDGTEFMLDAAAGYFRTPLEIFASFSSALVDVKQQIKAQELASDPLDERYDSASILSVSLNGTSASITVSIRSKAGSEAQFIVPLETRI